VFRLPWESVCRTEARSSGSWPEKALLWRVPPSLLLLNDAGGEGWRSEKNPVSRSSTCLRLYVERSMEEESPVTTVLNYISVFNSKALIGYVYLTELHSTENATLQCKRFDVAL